MNAKGRILGFVPGTNNSRLRFLRIAGPIYLLISFFLTPGAFSICLFYSITGLPCPGCGMTRSIHYLMHGDVIHSLQYHFFGWIVFLLCVYGTVTLFSDRACRFFEKWEPRAQRFAIPALLLLAVYGAVRILALYSPWFSSTSSVTGGWFASFDEPGFFRFLLGSLFRSGSF
ncbi:MAG: DUF2752 domain-containing protein [Leptospiraceae bacterium]|nr:DUF2752 domain-containing protein [Leptospiraceae bacterium]